MSTSAHPCQRCNLCCDGTLFNRVPVAEQEIEALVGRFALLQSEEGMGFSLPCPSSTATGCACYADRPQICRKYRCTSLIACEESQIDESELRRRIASALAARQRLLALAPPGTRFHELRSSLLSQPETDRDCDQHLALGVVELMLDRFFREDGIRAMSRGK